MATTFSRRSMLASCAGAGSVSLGACSGIGRVVPARAATVPLPDAAAIRRDYQAMVDFGPRLPGNANHKRYVASMASDFAKAGLNLVQSEEYPYVFWKPADFGLKVGVGDAMQAVPDTAYYVRSASTGPDGIEGQLYYAGHFDSPTMEADLAAIPAGAIVVMDGRLPQMTIRKLVNLRYLQESGEHADAYLDRPYKRLWLTPGFKLDRLREAGAAGVIIIMDVSSDMIRNNFSPHSQSYKPPLPALFVGADTGERLRAQARQGQRATLTLDADWVDGYCPQITAVLPGRSDEVIIINTHTDGQNFIEENGCVAMLQLARHFASLPWAERLTRTVVFAAWPGHMTGELPQCEGWMRAHPELVKRAVAAFTIEHLGAPEWEDIPDVGYAPTGRNEYMNFATTDGVLTQVVREALQKYGLAQHGIEVAPGITTGAAFHASGIPHMGSICGPNYLLGIAENGHIDKLDAELAARQTRMIAEIIKRVDRIPAQDLRAGDSTLGADPVEGLTTGMTSSRPASAADA